ncbi:2-succinyl-6-hydroxy-2,4-cyclohexadiene-1-carboxylate synthase [Pasteurellaceae bacterium Macca]|nr:2-succinyl-6-hydroxy-2,4-cyclohexadiene-1-carboxylate synthase [Pasteurellaceae bacterium Macca]
MLAAQWFAKQGKPVVFLHGLLGSRHDWATLFSHLQKKGEIRPLAIDLPFHGDSQAISCVHFDDCRALIHQTLCHYLGDESFHLVGYSLGGRLALDYYFHAPHRYLQGVLLEGANIGLSTPQERASRWQHDCAWSARFRHESMANVLEDWYQQAVFADLTPPQRQALIAQRQHQSGEKIAQMLQATSLAKQPCFAEKLATSGERVAFILGEADSKFRQMVSYYQLPYRLVPHAGHNAHWANPQAFGEQLGQFIQYPKRS